MRHAFVVGCPRSGTSWVRNILDQHPLVKCGPESHLFTMVHGVVDAAGDWPVDWLKVLDRFDAFAGQPVGPHRWTNREHLVGLLESARASADEPRVIADDLIAHVFAHYAAHNRLTDEHVLVEKTPNHLFYAERILKRFPDAAIVEVRRDGRDVCVSMERRAKRVDWPPKHRQEQIDTWATAVREGLAQSAKPHHIGRWHVVSYEGLIADRARRIEALFSALGLGIDPVLLSQIVDRTDISRVKRVGDGEHVRKGIAGDWPNYFDIDDLQLFFDRAGDVFDAAGYCR